MKLTSIRNSNGSQTIMATMNREQFDAIKKALDKIIQIKLNLGIKHENINEVNVRNDMEFR